MLRAPWCSEPYAGQALRYQLKPRDRILTLHSFSSTQFQPPQWPLLWLQTLWFSWFCFPPTSVLLPSILGWFFSSLCFGEAPCTLLFSSDYSSCAEIRHKVLLWFLYIPHLMDLWAISYVRLLWTVLPQISCTWFKSLSAHIPLECLPRNVVTKHQGVCTWGIDEYTYRFHLNTVSFPQLYVSASQSLPISTQGNLWFPFSHCSKTRDFLITDNINFYSPPNIIQRQS